MSHTLSNRLEERLLYAVNAYISEDFLAPGILNQERETQKLHNVKRCHPHVHPVVSIEMINRLTSAQSHLPGAQV